MEHKVYTCDLSITEGESKILSEEEIIKIKFPIGQKDGKLVYTEYDSSLEGVKFVLNYMFSDLLQDQQLIQLKNILDERKQQVQTYLTTNQQ